MAVAGRWMMAVVMAAVLLSSCTIGEGEGPRYTGRVVSIDEHQLCLGPNTSSRTGTCGSIPDGATNLPRVGDCVSLFGHPYDQGRKIRWSSSGLSRRVDDKRCS
jgi:hypothetical protein